MFVDLLLQEVSYFLFLVEFLYDAKRMHKVGESLHMVSSYCAMYLLHWGRFTHEKV